MVDSANNIILSGRALYRDNQILSNLKDASEGGCGALGLISNIKVKGKHIYQPSVQMQNRGNGKGGGIAAAGLDPDYLGISNQVLKENYLLMVAFTDTSVMEELEQNFITPFFDIADARVWETKGDYRDLGLTIKPPEVKRYFVRVKPVLLKKFMTDLPGISARDAEDEFVWRNSYKINDSFYAGTDKRAFVLSHARDLAILKIVGYAENVIQYYGLEEMPANIWLSHQRYPTRGMVWHPGGSHPFIGMNQALIHNGGFANYHPMT
ncbi:MAG: glutamate synthase, partial [Lentisphaerae bacterium]|nr:glutamate synthase [Lentisphaerota bacterium]